MKTGRKKSTYFALALYDPFRPKGTRLNGRYDSQQQAEFEQQHYGGHVVKVTETISWEPVEAKELKVAKP